MKTCARCAKSKPLEDFRMMTKSSDGRQKWCRSCFAAYDRERYNAGDSVRVRANHNARIDRNKAFVKQYLESHSCVGCGDSDWWNLDFDHLDQSTKTKNVADIIRDNGMKRLVDEIALCVVRCTKCHRRRTIEQCGWWRTISDT